MAARASPRTTKLYGRTGDEITLEEVERIGDLNCRGDRQLAGSRCLGAKDPVREVCLREEVGRLAREQQAASGTTPGAPVGAHRL